MIIDGAHSSNILLHAKHQMDDLYTQIEDFFRSLQHSCLQRCNIKLADYLYHGSQLPQGIQFKPEPDHARIIQKVLQQYPIEHDLETIQFIHNPVRDLLRAYKFWFNPCRLIDALMGLWLSANREESPGKSDFKKFHQYLHTLFKTISTSKCIDLYGYLSNKDTRYLQLSLEIVLSEKSHPSLPSVATGSKKNIHLIAHLIGLVVEQLRLELKERSISTSILPGMSPSLDHFQPGKRNCEAIEHIIQFYCDSSKNTNSKIEDLLKDLES